MSVTHGLTGQRIYTATAADDLLVAQWWMRMVNDDDLERVFSKDSWSLSALFRIITYPKTLVYQADAEGIWFAMWGEQLLNGAVVGVWIRRDRRHTRAALHALLDAETWYLHALPTLFVITRHEALAGSRKGVLSPLERLGYTVLDRVEGWMDGRDAWIGKLTRREHQAVLRRYGRQSVELAQVMEPA